MRSTASGIALLLALTACHWNRPAKDAESSEDSEPSSEPSPSPKSGESAASGESPKASGEAESSPSSALGSTGVGRTAGRAEKATIRDDTEKRESPCSGAAIADLLASLSQASCELPANAPAPQQPTPKDALEVTVTPDQPKIFPGSTAKISVVFKNKGKTKLPLDFTVDPDPRFVFELYTPKGARVDKPPGNEPALPSEAADNPAPDPHTARITLFPNGTATLVLPWQAVRYKWASKEKAKGALPGRGYPREPAGPVPRGKFVLRVVTPLTNVEEGVEHELTQPRAKIEIGGNAPAPEPAAAAPVKKGPAPAPSAPPSDSTIEAKFLKATGGSATPPATKKH
jgi:hypothetical protein